MRDTMEGHRLTAEDRAKGRRNRWALVTPEQRQKWAIRQAVRRWYKINADDTERIDKMLIHLSRQVADAMIEEDRRGVIMGISAMVPLERIKIMLRQSSIQNVTPSTPGEVVEGQSEIEKKLEETQKRRQAAMTIEVESEKLPSE